MYSLPVIQVLAFNSLIITAINIFRRGLAAYAKDAFRVAAVVAALMLSAEAVCAQKTKHIKVDFTYYAPLTMSVKEAQLKAIEAAQADAMGREFGTLVVQHVTSTAASVNGNDYDDFHSIGGSEVRGEWLETTVDPKFEYKIDDDLELHVTFEGVAREIVQAPIDLQLTLLRNGTEQRFASTEFNHGDDLYMSFSSPVDGYLAVYLVDETSGNVYQMLPYRSSPGNSVKVKSDKNYVFFSVDAVPATERHVVDEYQMESDDPVSWSIIYAIFSTNPFAKPVATETEGGVKQLRRPEFFSWLGNARKSDSQMNVRIIPTRITNNTKTQI